MIPWNMEAPNQLVVISVGDLMSLIKNTVQDVFIENQSNDVRPELLDRTEAARALGMSTGMLDQLRKNGMPCVRVGESPRFRVADCIAWLQRRSTEGGK